MDYFKLSIFVLLILFSFHAFADEQGTSVGVSVEYYCETGMNEFSSPGNGTLAKNSTGHFVADMYNSGNYRSNVTVHYVNVTRQNESYEDGDDIGEVLKVYESANYTNRSVGDRFYYIKTFNGTYEEGWYAGHIKVETSCNTSSVNNDSEGVKKYNFTRHNSFEIITAYGEQGGVNTTGNQTTNKTFPDEINQTGNESTNETLPQNYSELGNESVNKTIPQDANQTGETSDQTIEGDNDNPGQTPEPEPEPTPEPTPRLEIDIEPVNSTYSAYQGRFAAARMRIQNIGNQEATDLTILPEISQIHPEWGIRSAQIANLSVNESVTRDVFIQPSEDQQPGRYVIPVVAENSERRLDLDYFLLEVNETELDPQISITESPTSVSVEVGTNQTIPVLVQNTGETSMNNVSVRLQNMEDCGTVESTSVESIAVNESASLQLTVSSNSNPESCNATMIVSSAEGAYAFSNVEFSTRPEQGLIPQEQRVPFIAIAWTVILAAYAVLRKQYELDSSMVRIPFILLLMGETFILLYMIVNYYGIVSVSFLPF